jgi:hypothetical protein
VPFVRHTERIACRLANATFGGRKAARDIGEPLCTEKCGSRHEKGQQRSFGHGVVMCGRMKTFNLMLVPSGPIPSNCSCSFALVLDGRDWRQRLAKLSGFQSRRETAAMTSCSRPVAAAGRIGVNGSPVQQIGVRFLTGGKLHRADADAVDGPARQLRTVKSI